MTGTDAYLLPCPGVDSQGPRIRSLAAEITRGIAGDSERASALFNWVRDTVRYIPYAPFAALEDYEPTRTLDRGYGFCTQKSALLVALARASGIPARFHYADLLNHNMPGRLGLVLGSNRMVYHTYADLRVNGRWLKVTPSFERSLCEKMGWRLVEFDGHGRCNPPRIGPSRPAPHRVCLGPWDRPRHPPAPDAPRLGGGLWDGGAGQVGRGYRPDGSEGMTDKVTM